MDVYEAVHTVLAVRAYQDKPIPKDLLRKIVDAGRLTASASNRQPWNFIVVEDRTMLVKLGGLARTGPYIAQASAAIIVAIENSPFGISDASRAIQSMILTAWSEGIASNWVGFHGLDAVKPVLGIPDSLDILAIVPLGFAANPIGKGKKTRKPFSEVVHSERFGNPF